MLNVLLFIFCVLMACLGVYHLSNIIYTLIFKRNNIKKCYIILPENDIEQMWHDVSLINRKIKNSKIIILSDNVKIIENIDISEINNIIYSSYENLAKTVKAYN